jgi:hypothetical protein
MLNISSDVALPSVDIKKKQKILLYIIFQYIPNLSNYTDIFDYIYIYFREKTWSLKVLK